MKQLVWVVLVARATAFIGVSRTALNPQSSWVTLDGNTHPHRRKAGPGQAGLLGGHPARPWGSLSQPPAACVRRGSCPAHPERRLDVGEVHPGKQKLGLWG